MKTKKYLIVPVLALLVAGCQDDDMGGGTAQPGDEVTFTVTTGETVATRTAYNAYYYPDYYTYYVEGNSSAWPIYWTDGDRVIISSPECAGNATYEITPREMQPNSARTVAPVDEGLRWGSSGSATFYSIYPAGNADFSPDDYTTVTLNVPREQECSFAVYNDGIVVFPDMESCFMYAKSSEGITNAASIMMYYVPFSTAIRFTLKGPLTDETVTVTRIEFSAPEGTNICGSFKADLKEADATYNGSVNNLPTWEYVSDSSGSNTIEVTVTDDNKNFLQLDKDDECDMFIFFLLAGKETVTLNEDWKLTVYTDKGTFTKSLELSGENNTLQRGQIHYLPDLPNLDAGTQTTNWLTGIARNTYLSEFTLPGSWESVKDYAQEDTTIADQFNQGIRAFHVSTRWWSEDSNDSEFRLSLADIIKDEFNEELLGSSRSIFYANEYRSFEKVVSDIVSCVEKQEDFAVLLVHQLFNSYDYNRSNGGWEAEVSRICAKYEDNIVDARNLTQNSVLADVLGKVIVIVETSTDVPDDLSNIEGSPCLFGQRNNRGTAIDSYSIHTGSYYSSTGGETGLSFQSTWTPVFSNRSDVLENDGIYGTGVQVSQYHIILQEMIANMETWYKSDDYAHDRWHILGMGGGDWNYSMSIDYDSPASTNNTWLEGEIDGMASSGYFPLGFVFMNKVSDYPDVVEKLLQINSKYKMVTDPSRSSLDGSPIGD